MDFADLDDNQNIMNVILEKFSDRIFNHMENVDTILGYFG